MGKTWRLPKNTIRLEFEGDEFEGIEVEATSLPLSEFFALQDLQQRAQNDLTAAEEVINKLGAVLTSWNITTGGDDEDEVPVPCNADGLKSLPLRYAMAILQAWMQAVAVVPNRSASASNAGVTSLENSIPMAGS